jgi:phosphoribosylanthranilate isomerase
MTVDNVTQSIDLLTPWAVDVSSGVETMPGVKSLEKIQAFVQAINKADRRIK